MATVDDLIDETEAHLTGLVGGSYNRLSADITTTTQQSIELEFDANGVVPGSVIGVGVEDIFVLEVSSDVVTKCIRGFRGSTAVIHATGDLVTVDPRFTRFRMFKAMQQEVASWGARLYAVSGDTITLADSTRGYTLDALGPRFLHVLQAQAEPTTIYTPNSSTWPDVEFRIARQMDTLDFAGGNAIFFNDYLYQGTGRRVRLTYATKFDPTSWTVDSDPVEDTGLAESMLDIPPLGAAWRLMISQEVRRTDSSAQGQSRRAEEVPAAAALQSTQALKAMRDARIAEEQLTLLATYGMHGGF